MKRIPLLVILIVFQLHSQSPVPEGTEPELIATGFRFVEGPVWSNNLGLLFSDMHGNIIYRWTETDSISEFLNPSDNSNGLTFDTNGILIMAQTGLRRIARLEEDGTQTSLADSYDGKKFNSPNDLAVKSDGSIFFTDPPFNIPEGEKQELTFSGIYRISPDGSLYLLDSTLTLPNGICFSKDESKLFVNDSKIRIIYIWDVVDDSTIANKREFASIVPVGYADGMKTDQEGNLYCAGPEGIWIFSPECNLLEKIPIPLNPTNCNWGDKDRNTLYITAVNRVYRIRLGSFKANNHQ